jgi:superfamily I DNA and/or RNA helicase
VQYGSIEKIKDSNFKEILFNPTDKGPGENGRKFEEEPPIRFNEKRWLDFNIKQRDVIADATRMVENSIMLIQGPPGTGKTKTIVGIIDSILKTLENESVEKAKILVCAPSNCAVDEIINRVLAADLIFTSKENLKGMISRVASPEYDGIPSMKPYTLREKARLVREEQNI